MGRVHGSSSRGRVGHPLETGGSNELLPVDAAAVIRLRAIKLAPSLVLLRRATLLVPARFCRSSALCAAAASCATAISAPPPSLPSLLPSLPSLTWADRLTPAADFDVQVRRLHSRHLSFRPPLMRTHASCSSLCTCLPPSPPLPLAACLPKRRARPFRPILHVPTLHRHRHRA